jgi:putative transposase
MRKRNRLLEFDYSTSNYYFITICVNHLLPKLGEVLEGNMILNDYGSIVKEKLSDLPNKYNYVDLDEFVIMPNHVHSIIIIDRANAPTVLSVAKKLSPDYSTQTSLDLSLQPKIKPLSELVGVFKTTSSKAIHEAGLHDFKWQRSFYDRIVRNEKELYNIRKYVNQNPLKWEIEKCDVENLDL